MLHPTHAGTAPGTGMGMATATAFTELWGQTHLDSHIPWEHWTGWDYQSPVPGCVPGGHSSISSQMDAPRKPRPAQLRTVGDPAVTAQLPWVIRCLPSSALAAFLP